MAKFCVNCGANLGDTASFCPGCGTQQGAAPQQVQQYQQAPAPAPKKKSKTPLIVGGIAGVCVIAIVAVLLATRPGSNSTGGNTPTGNNARDSISIGMNKMSAGFSKAMEAIDSGNAETLDWPAASFPAGFPAYPGGSVIYMDALFEGDAMVFVTDTGRASYNSYINTLKGAGWTFTDPEEGCELAYKGAWMLFLSYDDDYGACIYVCDMGFDLADLYTEAEWPANLPVAIPVYPDGNVTFVSENESISILIENTSKSARDAYVRQLTDAGWQSLGDNHLMLETDEGDWFFGLQYDEADQSLFLGLFLMKKSDSDAQALEFNGWGEDEFTRQIPKPDFQMSVPSLTEDTFIAVFNNITVPMAKGYAQKVIAAGFTVDGKAEETAETYCYGAVNDKGYSIVITLFSGETMYITVAK